MKLDIGEFYGKSQLNVGFNLDADSDGDHLRARNCSGGLSLFSHPEGSRLVPRQSVWDLRWTKWLLKMFLFRYFSFPLSSSHQCFIIIHSSLPEAT